MTNPTDTAEEAARAKLSWIESECPDVYDALILDVAALLRERERAGIEKCADAVKAGFVDGHDLGAARINTAIFNAANRCRALLTKEGK